MRELSLHIMDVIENGISAKANLISLYIEENKKENLLRIIISDNGHGIPDSLIKKVMDPFFTTRTTRRVGLGLSLFKEASKRCEGEFNITSKTGKGTKVEASFKLDHIDLAPLGDMASTLTGLVMGNSHVDFVYTHIIDGKDFSLDTREIKNEMEDLSLTDPIVIHHLTNSIRSSLQRLELDEDELEEREDNDGQTDN